MHMSFSKSLGNLKRVTDRGEILMTAVCTLRLAVLVPCEILNSSSEKLLH